MSFIIVALGNPGDEYKQSRHNTGRLVLEQFRKKLGFSDWEKDKRLNALTAEGKVKREKVLLLEPETFMNNSGKSVAPLVKTKKAAEQLVVIHDDLDLPLGAMKLSFNRGSGGHKGVEAVKRAIKTEAFIRLRIGISPSTPSGKLRKPKEVNDFILADFKQKEMDVLKKVAKRASDALSLMVTDGREKAMGEYN